MFSFFPRRNTGRATQRPAAVRRKPTLEVPENRPLMDATAAIGVVSGVDGGIICDRVCPPPPPPEPLLSDVIQETVTVVLNAAQTGMINLAVAKPLEIT